MRANCDPITAVAGVSADRGEAEAGTVYTYKPSLFGAVWQFALADDGIHWSAGLRGGVVPYDKVRRLRMSFRPANMQAYRFLTEIWADGAPKLRLVSASWKSMFEQERLDGAYSAFVRELHRRLAQANAPALYQQGMHPLQFWPVVALFAAVAVGLAALILRALQQGAFGGAAFIVAFLLFFFWQGGNYLRRNRPATYHVDALPLLLLPKG